MMHKIAFDIGGVLSDHQILLGLARTLAVSESWEVHIISAIGTGDTEREKSYHDQFDGLVRADRVHIVRFTSGKDIEAAVAKVVIMREHAITVLIDDNPTICDYVRKAGLMALQVFYG